MRNLRKLGLFAIAALAAMAFAASAASAQSEGDLSVTAEPGGFSCPAVSIVGTNVTGGCLLHANSENPPGIKLRKHVFGVESQITGCTHELHGRMNAQGEGYIFEQVLAGAGCSRQACKDVAAEGIPWHATGHEQFPVPFDPEATPTSREYGATEFCVEPLGGGTDELCDINIGFSEIGNTHVYEGGHTITSVGPPPVPEMPGTSTPVGFRCELAGHWLTETGGTHDSQTEVRAEIAHL